MVSLYDEKLINNQLKVEYFSIRSDRDCGEEKWIQNKEYRKEDVLKEGK